MIDRRRLMAIGAAAGVLVTGAKALAAEANLPPVYDIWPGAAPGGEKVTVTERVVPRDPKGDPLDTAYYNVTRPWMMHRIPKKPNGAAILMAPGGGYVRVAVRKTGGDLDQWLADQGFHVFVMNYRLPADGWAAGPDVALQDAQRAIRVIRFRAVEFGIDPARVGVMGFSAGGHVAGRLATQFHRDTYAPIDAADSLSTRPDVAGLFYPVITMTDPWAHKGSRKEMLGTAPTVDAEKATSVELSVPADVPPIVVCGTTDDPVVPMQNAILIYQAVKTQKVASELFLYEGATHGFSLKDKSGAVNDWAIKGLAFMSRHGLVPVAKA
jgi:acetyl esterase/lipase